MLDWISKLLGGHAVVPDGVPEEWPQRVQQVLAPLDVPQNPGGRPGLAREVLCYLLTGAPEAVLTDVRTRPVVSAALGVRGPSRLGGLPDLYEHFEALPIPVALRWVRLVEASLAAQGFGPSLPLPRGTHWPEALLLGSARFGPGSRSQRPKASGISAERMEALLRADELDPAALLVAGFAVPLEPYSGREERAMLVTDLIGYPEALHRHLEAIRPHVASGNVTMRLHVLQNMLAPALAGTLDALAPQLCELAVASSKQVREAAGPVLRKCGDVVFEPLRALASSGTPEQRAHALRLMAALASERGAPAWRAVARDIAAADKAASVRELAAGLGRERQPVEEAASMPNHVVPAIDWSESASTPRHLLDSFWREVNQGIARDDARAQEWAARTKAAGKNSYPPPKATPQFSGEQAAALLAYLAEASPTPPGRVARSMRALHHVSTGLQRLVATGSVTPVATLKLLRFLDMLPEDPGTLSHDAIVVFNDLHRATGRPTLIELARMLEDTGRQPDAVLRAWCAGWGSPLGEDWRDEDAWPYFASRVDQLLRLVASDTSKDYAFNRGRLFRALGTLPVLPSRAVEALVDVALGDVKADRAPAQQALQRHAGKERRIIEALEDGRSERRAQAAKWLGSLRHAEAIPALERAVATEKNDLAKGAMIDALELLGQPVEKYLDPRSWGADARKLLGKALPKELDWFPWDALPQVRWAADRSPVDRDVVKWMLVQACKQKQPEPNAILRKCCAMFDARDREALGQFVLETWLHQDVVPIAPDDAMSRARASAQSLHQQMTQHPQYFTANPILGMSVEQLLAMLLPGFQRQPAGSAIASKGLLAVAGACCGERAAAPVQRYLKEWYGTRAAQGKALIAMLAWIDHPSATQLMLSVGSRFRTKSFQEEATRQAEALAERKGWTLAELADRTIPCAGFDETGTLELSYGARAFTARLLPDFKIELFNPEGRKISALPDPRQDDDAERAKEAKKAFSAAKKEVKSVVALQAARLYEALCTEREWPAADWIAFLQQHPIMRHLIQRLAWVQVEDGRITASFRPLDDGTLTDLEDNPVSLAPGASVRLAHDSLLAPEAVAAWQRHLADYEIEPLFQQLGKGSYALPDDKGRQHEIKDFEGHLLQAFSLRGRASKLGYTRGATEDAGWFYTYEKRFPTLGLEAVIQFSGNPLPEENRTVALKSLSFRRTGVRGSMGSSTIALADVPKVLLSECHGDLRLMAAEGPGYDADWERKTDFS